MSLSPEQLTHMHGDIDHHLRSQMQRLFNSKEIEWVGYTADADNENDIVAVYRAESSQWDELVRKFTAGDFKDGPLFFDLSVSDIYCMDAGEDVGLMPLTECATGQPCMFLPNQVRLEDYYGQSAENLIPVDDVDESSAILLSTIMAFVWAFFF